MVCVSFKQEVGRNSKNMSGSRELFGTEKIVTRVSACRETRTATVKSRDQMGSAILLLRLLKIEEKKDQVWKKRISEVR